MSPPPLPGKVGKSANDPVNSEPVAVDTIPSTASANDSIAVNNPATDFYHKSDFEPVPSPEAAAASLSMVEASASFISTAYTPDDFPGQLFPSTFKPPDLVGSVDDYLTTPSPVNSDALPRIELAVLMAAANRCHRAGQSTSSASQQSLGRPLNKAEKAQCAKFREKRRRRRPSRSPSSSSSQPTTSIRQTLPPLHLHLSKDGTSPLPPGWHRAMISSSDTAPDGGPDDASSYPYYYYHAKTRLTRWDPPVYPWDADPQIDGQNDGGGSDDPEAPYNWGCASKWAVTRDDIEAMQARIRQRTLERQCMELINEMAASAVGSSSNSTSTIHFYPTGAAEHSFAFELYTAVHNVLREFRDGYHSMGRITNDEDLYYLTRKEIQKLRQQQAVHNASLFNSGPGAELTPTVLNRLALYTRKYMESKGQVVYRRRSECHPPAAPAANRPIAATAQPSASGDGPRRRSRVTPATDAPPGGQQPV